MNLILIAGSIYVLERQIIEEDTFVKETMVDTEVTYTLEHTGKFYIIEHVPALVCKETGEQFFSPDVVEHIQELTKSNKKPNRFIETPVYLYA